MSEYRNGFQILLRPCGSRFVYLRNMLDRLVPSVCFIMPPTKIERPATGKRLRRIHHLLTPTRCLMGSIRASAGVLANYRPHDESNYHVAARISMASRRMTTHSRTPVLAIAGWFAGRVPQGHRATSNTLKAESEAPANRNLAERKCSTEEELDGELQFRCLPKKTRSSGPCVCG